MSGRQRTDLLATRIGLPWLRATIESALRSKASRSTTAYGGVRCAVAADRASIRSVLARMFSTLGQRND